MRTKVFLNLPVKDLEAAKSFYVALGWSINPNFSDDTAACVVISDEVHAMLVTHDKFRQFTNRPIAEANVSEVLIALSASSLDEMNRIVDSALAAGGRVAMPPQNYGFMQHRSFIDPDGHHWEIIYMDPAALPPG